MESEVPKVLARLLHAVDEPTRDSAWKSFVAEYSRLLMFVARSTSPDHDASMDAYAFVLEKLHEQDLRRLRGYASDGRGKFTTWLVVVTRRICLDFRRHRYGRATTQDDSGREHDARAVRRRLVDLAIAGGDDALAAQAGDDDPDEELRRSELERALGAALTELPAPDRLLLAFRFQDGLSAAEIAPLLKFASPFHVYRRLNHLLLGLRRRLLRVGVESSVP